MTRADIDRLPAYRYRRAHVIQTDDRRRAPTAPDVWVVTRESLRAAYQQVRR